MKMITKIPIAGIDYKTKNHYTRDFMEILPKKGVYPRIIGKKRCWVMIDEYPTIDHPVWEFRIVREFKNEAEEKKEYKKWYEHYTNIAKQKHDVKKQKKIAKLLSEGYKFYTNAQIKKQFNVRDRDELRRNAISRDRGVKAWYFWESDNGMYIKL